MQQPAPWCPRSGFEELAGYVWLGRMLDKARRSLTDPLGDYLLFGRSPIDRAALGHFRVRGDELVGWVREGLSDEAIAARLVARLGESEARRRAWNAQFTLVYGLFMAGIDADEGRLPPGPHTAVLRGLIGVVSPIVARLPLGER